MLAGMVSGRRPDCAGEFQGEIPARADASKHFPVSAERRLVLAGRGLCADRAMASGARIHPQGLGDLKESAQ